MHLPHLSSSVGGKVHLGLIPEEFFSSLILKLLSHDPVPLELGLSYIVYLKKDVITPGTSSTILVVGSVIKVIKSTVPLLETLLTTSLSVEVLT